MGQPLVVAYGMGVDSTALLVGFAHRGIRPDLILFADTGGEKDETYAYRAVVNEFLCRSGFPLVTVVRNQVQDYKNWPPYETLEENCLTNGTLPSIAFGFKSCSLKWKAAPQNRFLKQWEPAQQAWAAGLKVRKAIGYDAGPADLRRRNHAGNENDPRYSYWYPLIEWGWDREECKRQIAKAGLPIPPKSSCFFCTAMKPAEVAPLPQDKLKRIVALEARARPRLTTTEGLWRKPVKGTRGGTPRPGSMTQFIQERNLLPLPVIEAIQRRVPLEIVQNQQRFANGEKTPCWEEFLCSL